VVQELWYGLALLFRAYFQVAYQLGKIALQDGFKHHAVGVLEGARDLFFTEFPLESPMPVKSGSVLHRREIGQSGEISRHCGDRAKCLRSGAIQHNEITNLEFVRPIRNFTTNSPPVRPSQCTSQQEEMHREKIDLSDANPARSRTQHLT